MNSLHPPDVFDMTDLEQILKEVRNLFLTSLESKDLKELATSLSEAKTKEHDLFQLGSKALMDIKKHSGEEELGQLYSSVEVAKGKCQLLQQEIDLLRSDSGNILHAKQMEEMSVLEQLVVEKEAEFTNLGGEARFRQISRLASSNLVQEGKPLPQLRKVLALLYNVTQIKWDLESAEEETSGRIVDNEMGVIKQFRFGQLEEFELANRIWSTIG